jgi:hypothetical protein
MNDIVGTFGLALLLAGLPLLLSRWWGCSVRAQAWVWFSTAVLSLLPLSDGSLVFFVRGILGDVSIATLALLIMVYYQLFVLNQHRRHNPLLSLLIVVLLGTLYASTTGYLAYDLYALGDEPRWLLLPCLFLLMLAWQLDRLQALAWLIGVLAFAGNLAPSRNLWDCLFDGYAFIGACVICVHALLKSWRFTRVSTPSSASMTI